ncbi:MAG: hypothetical protein AAGH38_02175 [Pseudomonadota bacterium]
MAVENLKSVQISKEEAGQNLMPSERSGRMRWAYGLVTTTETTSSSGSTYRMVRIPAHAVPVHIDIFAVGNPPATNLPNVSCGAMSVEDESLFDIDSISVGTVLDDLGNHPQLGRGNLTTDQQAWEFTGASENPGGDVDILIALSTDATVAGTISMNVYYVVD